ncbi:MAG: beta-lactamase family protein [Planctomycetia bacterium]|nr:beta-lactamase family protein [Planctomycetia bacterium]
MLDRRQFLLATAAGATTAFLKQIASADDSVDRRLAKIAPQMREFVDAKQISGAVTLVAHKGKTVHLEAVGEADVADHRPMTKDTLFGIASMTKPITATAVMMLQDDRKLSIDDPVSKYIPKFKNAQLATGKPSREITIRDLMTHTSGLPGDQGVKDGSLEKTADEMAARTLAFQPGSKWQYSPGLTVCGRVIEIVSGASYENFLKKRIFQPLKMSESTFDLTPEQRRRLAVLYKPGADKKSIEPATPQLAGDGAPTYGPSGGLFSTAAEIVRFYQMILNGGELEGIRIVSRDAVAQMTRIQTGELVTGFTPGNGWGLGFCIVREPQEVSKMLSPGTFGHGGAWGTQCWVDPKREVIYLLMIQRRDFGNSDASEIRGAFQELAAESLFGRAQ